MNSSQLILDFDKKDKADFCDEDFLLHGENKKVFEFLDRFFAQKDEVESFMKSAIVKGARLSGKSYILHVFANKFSPIIIDKNSLEKEALSSFFVKNQFYILEDIDELGDDNLLFHILNSAQENGAFLLMSAEDLGVFKLKDLNSRIRNIFVCEIENPSVETLKMLLFHGFALRQMKISDDVVAFLSENIDRNYEAVFDAVKRVEKACFENKGRFGLKEVKGWF